MVLSNAFYIILPKLTVSWSYLSWSSRHLCSKNFNNPGKWEKICKSTENMQTKIYSYIGHDFRDILGVVGEEINKSQHEPFHVPKDDIFILLFSHFSLSDSTRTDLSELREWAVCKTSGIGERVRMRIDNWDRERGTCTVFIFVERTLSFVWFCFSLTHFFPSKIKIYLVNLFFHKKMNQSLFQLNNSGNHYIPLDI